MKNIRLFVVLFATAFILGSCTKNDDTTLTLLGTEGYVVDYDRYFHEIMAAVPSSQVNYFKEKLRIYEGNIPPKIEGEYVFGPKRRLASNVAASNWPLNVYEPNVYLKFSDQHNRVATMIHYEEFITETDTVYLRGSGERFVAYYIEDKELEYGMNKVVIKRGVIYSGRICNEGIKYLQYATVIMDVQNDTNGAIETYPVGTFFIYEDDSYEGLAERKDWYNE